MLHCGSVSRGLSLSLGKCCKPSAGARQHDHVHVVAIVRIGAVRRRESSQLRQPQGAQSSAAAAAAAGRGPSHVHNMNEEDGEKRRRRRRRGAGAYRRHRVGANARPPPPATAGPSAARGENRRAANGAAPAHPAQLQHAFAYRVGGWRPTRGRRVRGWLLRLLGARVGSSTCVLHKRRQRRRRTAQHTARCGAFTEGGGAGPPCHPSWHVYGVSRAAGLHTAAETHVQSLGRSIDGMHNKGHTKRAGGQRATRLRVLLTAGEG